MESLWQTVCCQFNVPEDINSKWLARLKQKMLSESHRYFHNWDKLLLGKKEYLTDASAIVILAVFFQYYDFDVKQDFIENNCLAFREFCKEANIEDNEETRKVLKLLGEEDVTNNEIDGMDENMDFFQDLDLVVLGSSPEEYHNYTQLLRKEYSHLDDNSYRLMRLKILQTFLTIPTIYSTKLFQDNLEERARGNIQIEIEELKKS